MWGQTELSPVFGSADEGAWPILQVFVLPVSLTVTIRLLRPALSPRTDNHERRHT
jgi:hypothetical protein